MSFYDDRILPHVINLACSSGQVMKQRSEVVPLARGVVLEVGMGSGLNLEFYDAERVELVYGLEPSEGMRRKAQPNLALSKVPVEWLGLPGEAIPLADESVDTIVLTFTLCTIPDWQGALQQMWRVLKRDGQLLFLEHGEAPDAAVRVWQNRLTPCWKNIAGGCHLNRNIEQLLRDGGFSIDALAHLYLPKTPRFAGFLYKGVARKPS